MLRILTIGLPDETVSWLEQRFGNISVQTTRNGIEVLAALTRHEWSLLALGPTLNHSSALEILGNIRKEGKFAHLPVVFCLDNSQQSSPTEQSVRQLGVTHLLTLPLNQEELAQQIAAILGFPLPREETPEQQEHRATTAAVAEVWQRFKETMQNRVAVLEQATVALLEGTLDDDLRQNAEREAHKLAGSVGVFGFLEGSRLAREIEQLFETGTPLGQAKALRLSELVVSLHTELERDPIPQGSVSSSGQEAPLLLVIDDDQELSERLPIDAAGRGFRTEIVRSLAAAKAILSRQCPDVLFASLASLENPEDRLALLVELNGQARPVPIVVLAENDTLVTRVKATKLGGQRFLLKPFSPAQLLEMASLVLRRFRVTETKVLAVEDDPRTSAILRTALESQGFQLTILDNALTFWEALERLTPDFLILDVDMSSFSGVDLCKVVRSDPQWAGLPVLFLATRVDADSVHRIFAAGADDFLRKPVAAPELIARIVDRIERMRVLLETADTDPLTGGIARRKADQILNRLFPLATRYQQPFSLALLALDHYQQQKDQYGSAAAKKVLRRLGELLLRTLRAEDVVIRWSEHQFLIGAYGMAREDSVQRLAETLEGLRQEEFTTSDDIHFRTTFSAGVAQYPGDGVDLATLCRTAEEVLTQAQEAGYDRVLPAGWEQQPIQSADVVLVDDDESLAGLLLHALETRGYHTQWLRDGQAAVEALAGSRPQLKARVVLLDVGLPSLDGLSVLRQLAQSGTLQHARVIVLTARSTEEEMLEALELGAVDYVTKPFSMPVLMRRIRRELHK